MVTAISANGVKLPYTDGKISTFGGITDTYKQERFYNLAYTTIDPDDTKKYGKGAMSVQNYLSRKWPAWYRNMFVGDSSRGTIAAENAKFGLFAYLNTAALYCAGRFCGTHYRKQLDNNNPWITFTNPANGKKITLLRIDSGPAKSTGKNWDLSPWGARYINAGERAEVKARFATKEEIKDAIAYMEALGNVGLENTSYYKNWFSNTKSSPTTQESKSESPLHASSSIPEGAETSYGTAYGPLLLASGFLTAAVIYNRGRK